MNHRHMSEGESVEHHRAIGVTRAEPSARHSLSTERLRAAFDGMAVGMILKGAEGETLESNPALRRMLGYGEEELRGMVRSDYTHPEDAGRDAELYRQLLAGERDNFRMEKRYVRKDGSVMWGRLSVSRIEGAEGEPAFAVGVVEDITESREAAQEIERLNRQNRLILDSAGEGIYGLDREGRTTFVNPAAAKLTGYDPEDLIGKSQHEVVHHSHPNGTPYPEEECPIYTALRDGKVHRVDDEVFWRKDGTSFPVEYASTPIMEDGEVAGAVVTFTDITERKESREALKESEKRYRTVVEQSAESIWLFDPDSKRVLESNPEFQKMLGYTAEELREMTNYDFVAHDPEDIDSAVKRVVQQRRGFFGERKYRRKDGTMLDVEVSGTVIPYKGKEVVCGVARDLSERKALEERLQYQAFHDSLTDLPNRTLVLDRLEHALARASRKGSSLAVLMVDLDDFKVINDTLGHDAGNAVLVEVAERLRACVRPGDTVGRIFGDEFAVLLEAPIGVEEARRVADRIQEAMRMPFDIAGQQAFVSASIGIALDETSEDTPGEVLKHADLALYEAKNHAVYYELYNPDMKTVAAERLDVVNGLRQAMEHDELAVHYQPKVLLQTGAFCGVEALVRWEHPERGLLPAARFIAIAEQIGLINRIGLWILRESCRQFKDWQERYPETFGPPLSGLCVNLSVREMQQPDLTEKVAKVLRETDLDPSHLMLEISERAAVKDVESTIGRLRSLKDLGVKLALDDFGTGYSSLSYLRRLPVDYLKLDKSFIAELGGDSQDRLLLSGVIDLAHDLDLTVVAEGVESAEHLAQLRQMGCDMAQGYHFAKPMPPEEILTLLLSDA
jgi:diguanylate cyclase (GGDEF)-like protein/PAS domain S-box-containing protein